MEAASGLTSYGGRSGRSGLFTIVLSELSVRDRASVLEENSYTFVERNRITIGVPIPPGRRAPWGDRHRVAVAKLAAQLNKGTHSRRFPALLLFTEGDRNTDEFVEVHIHGYFNRRAVECINELVAPTRDTEISDVARARDVLAALKTP